MKLTSLLPLCFFLPRPSQQRPLLSIPHRRQSIHPTENDPLKNNVFEDFGINPAEDTWTADKADIPTDSTPLRPITVPINRPAPASNIPAGLRGRNDARFTRRRLAARGHLLHTGDAHPTFAALYSGNLTNEANDLYVANVTLSNNQTFSMDLDTGSSDTWFRGFGCVTTVLAQDTSCDGRAVTSFAGMEHLKLSYVDLYGVGVSCGAVFKANVTLAGLSSTIAIGVSFVELEMGGSDGLLGLAYPSISSIGQVTPFTGVHSNWFDALHHAYLPERAFGFYLSNANDGDAGEVTFGGYNPSRYTGPVSWFPLVDKFPLTDPRSPGYWSFDFGGWVWRVQGGVNGSVGGTGNLSTGMKDPYGATTWGIADTGTTFLVIPTTPALALMAALGAVYETAMQGYVVPCNNSLPDVELVTSLGTVLSIPSSVYTFYAGNDTNGRAVCTPGIVGGGDGVTIFGDVMTRAYYTFFDRGGKRVGFAQAVHTTPEETLTSVL